MNALTQILPGDVVWRLGWTLLHFLWEGVAIALGAGVLLAALRRRSAAGRYVAGCSALALMLATVAGTFVILPDRAQTSGPAIEMVSMTPAAEIAVAGIPTPEERPASAADTTSPMRSAPVTPIPSTTRPRAPDLWAGFVQWCEPYLPWVVLVWAAGLLVLSLRLAGGWLQVRRMRCGRVEPVSRELEHLLDDLAADLRVHRPVRLVHSTAAHVPMAIGCLRPMILLPVSAITGLTEDQLRAVLAHELAHIRRHDYLVNILQCIVETLLFYHPAVWWLSRRIRIEREHCCDDIAVAACGDRLSYARALTHLEELRYHGIRLAAAANGGTLVGRIRRLLGVPEHRRPGGWLAGALALSLVIATGVGLRLALGSQESDAGKPGPALIGTWSFENSVGDDEQMSVFPDGRVLVIYSNGHHDDTRLHNGKVTVQEYGGAETTLSAASDGTLLQHARQYTPERKIWKRIDAEPRERLLRVLTGPVKRQPVERVRCFVRIVTDGERVTFEGQETAWDAIRPLLAQVPDRARTVLELAVASGDVTLRQLNDAQNRTLALAQEFGFEYMSYIGEHVMGSKGSDAQLISDPRPSPQGHKLQAAIVPATQPASQPDGAAESRNVSGRVLLPDGAPAAGAHVAIVLPEHQLRYANGRFDREVHRRTEQQPQDVTTTCDAEGRFSIPAPQGGRAVVATHDGGYGEALVNALSDAPIRLESWATAAGTVGQGRYPDGRPVQVILHANRAIGATEIGRSDELRLEYIVDANADGSFRFDRVAPGRYWVHRKLSWRVDGGDPVVDVAAGASLRVTLARTVTGRILKARDQNLLIHPRFVTMRIEAVSPYPAWSGTTSELEAVATHYSNFLASDEFEAYTRENVPVDEDGRFLIENLPPATYKLSVHILADGAAPADGPGFRYATTSRTFTVPVAVGETPAQPVDVGFILAGGLEPVTRADSPATATQPSSSHTGRRTDVRPRQIAIESRFIAVPAAQDQVMQKRLAGATRVQLDARHEGMFLEANDVAKLLDAGPVLQVRETPRLISFEGKDAFVDVHGAEYVQLPILKSRSGEPYRRAVLPPDGKAPAGARGVFGVPYGSTLTVKPTVSRDRSLLSLDLDILCSARLESKRQLEVVHRTFSVTMPDGQFVLVRCPFQEYRITGVAAVPKIDPGQADLFDIMTEPVKGNGRPDRFLYLLVRASVLPDAAATAPAAAIEAVSETDTGLRRVAHIDEWDGYHHLRMAKDEQFFELGHLVEIDDSAAIDCRHTLGGHAHQVRLAGTDGQWRAGRVIRTRQVDGITHERVLFEGIPLHAPCRVSVDVASSLNLEGRKLDLLWPTPPDPGDMKNAAFAPAIERTISAGPRFRENTVVDLDSGDVFPTSQHPEAEDRIRFARRRGLDVSIRFAEIFGRIHGLFLQFDLTAALVRLKPEAWESMSPASLVGDPRFLNAEFKFRGELLAWRDLPVVYAFRTDRGMLGLLRLETPSTSDMKVKIKRAIPNSRLNATPGRATSSGEEMPVASW